MRKSITVSEMVTGGIPSVRWFRQVKSFETAEGAVVLNHPSIEGV